MPAAAIVVLAAYIGTTAATIAVGAVTGAVIGAVIGAGVAAATGRDIGKGALYGALAGAVTGGVSAWLSAPAAGAGGAAGGVEGGTAGGASGSMGTNVAVNMPTMSAAESQALISASTVAPATTATTVSATEATAAEALKQASTKQIYAGIGQGASQAVGQVGAGLIEERGEEKRSKKELEAERLSASERFSRESERIAGNVPGQFEAQTANIEIPEWWNRHLIDERINRGLLEPAIAPIVPIPVGV